MPFLPYKGFALMGHLKTAKCKCLRSRANYQVRMFVKKQPNRWLQQVLAVETANSQHDVPTHTNFFVLSTSHWHAFRKALH